MGEDSIDELIQEIEAEKEHIIYTLDALRKTLSRKEITFVEIAAVATFIQNAYNGIENILKRTLKYMKIPIRFSESWHKDLLELSAENRIISFELMKRLDEYRAFRHFFVHGYGIMLDKKKLMPLAKKLPRLWRDFESELEKLLKSLKFK